eukprot:7378380-Prymnesium_polylepis.1
MVRGWVGGAAHMLVSPLRPISVGTVPLTFQTYLRAAQPGRGSALQNGWPATPRPKRWEGGGCGGRGRGKSG